MERTISILPPFFVLGTVLEENKGRICHGGLVDD
jgi:hypothetical protein